MNGKKKIINILIIFLAISLIILYFYSNIYNLKENFESERYANTYTTETSPTLTVQNSAKIRAKYEYDEKRDESNINFSVKIPQNLISTYDLTDEKFGYNAYRLTGFCNAPNATSDTIQEKCSKLDDYTCTNTSCCVLLGGTKCVAGDERGPTFDNYYNDVELNSRDRYYYMGNCYGDCNGLIVKDYSFVYPPSYTLGDLYKRYTPITTKTPVPSKTIAPLNFNSTKTTVPLNTNIPTK